MNRRLEEELKSARPVLSIYLSTTSAVFTFAGHVNILHYYKIGQNTEKSPGDLRRLAVIQT